MVSSLFRSLKNNDFTILISLYFLLLPIGKTLWYPLFVMAVIGGFALFKEFRGEGISSGAKWLLLGGSFIWVPAIFSMINTIDSGRTLQFIGTYPLFFLAGYFIYKRVSAGVFIMPAVHFISLIVVVWGAFAIWQYVDPQNPFGPGVDRFQGMHTSDNKFYDGGLMMGVILGSLLPFLVFVFWSKGFKLVAVILGLFIIALVLLSGTRSAWISVLFAIISVPAFVFLRGIKPRLHGYLFSLALFGIIIIGISHAYYQDSLNSRLERTFSVLANPTWDGLNYASSGRLAIWDDAVQLGLTSPVVGTGVNNFRFAQPLLPTISSFRHDWNKDGHSLIGPTHAHQIILEAWSGAGALGLIGLLVYFVWLARTTIQVGKTGSLLAFGALVALWAGFFPFNTHNNLYGGWMSAWFWVWMGISAGLIYRQDSKPS